MGFKNSISLKSFFATTLFCGNCFFWNLLEFPKADSLEDSHISEKNREKELCDLSGKKRTQQKRKFTPFEHSSDFRLIEEHCVNVLELEPYIKIQNSNDNKLPHQKSFCTDL